MEELRSPAFGFAPHQRKHIQIAGGELARAISTLEAQHRDHPAILAAVRERLGFSDLEGNVLGHSMVLFDRAEVFAEQRARLVASLLPLRTMVVDACLDAQKLLPAHAMQGLDTEADDYESPPSTQRVGGGELDQAELMIVWMKTYEWTRRTTSFAALRAVGPAYTLSLPVPQNVEAAQELRRRAGQAHSDLSAFLHAAWGSNPNG